MYLEGLIIASFAGAMSQTSKVMWPLLLIFWPIALPILAYKTYVKYQPLIQQVQENPLLGSLLGFSRPTADPTVNPLASLLGPTVVPPFPKDQPNPFLTGLFTEAEPLLVEVAELDKALDPLASALTEKPTESNEPNKSNEGEQS